MSAICDDTAKAQRTFTLLLYCSNCDTEQEQEFQFGSVVEDSHEPWTKPSVKVAGKFVACLNCGSRSLNKRQRKHVQAVQTVPLHERSPRARSPEEEYARSWCREFKFPFREDCPEDERLLTQATHAINALPVLIRVIDELEANRCS